MDKSYIIAVIQRLTEEKRNKNIAPDYALLPDVLNRITIDAKRILWDLVKQGTLKMHDTLNTKAFEAKGK